MLEAGTIRGARGLVKFAYLTAAEVTGFVIARDDLTRAWIVQGTVAASDSYLLTFPGLEFVVPHKGGAWRWRIESCRIAAAAFTARLKGELV